MGIVARHLCKEQYYLPVYGYGHRTVVCIKVEIWINMVNQLALITSLLRVHPNYTLI